MKPHIYATYYPKLRRMFWRVSKMPNPCNREMYLLWREAHRFVDELNRTAPT